MFYKRKLTKKQSSIISEQNEKSLKIVKNGTRTKQLLTFNGLLKIKVKRYVNSSVAVSLYKKFSRASKAFENFLRYCLFLNMSYRKIQNLVFEMTRSLWLNQSTLAKLAKTKNQYVDIFNHKKIISTITTYLLTLVITKFTANSIHQLVNLSMIII